MSHLMERITARFAVWGVLRLNDRVLLEGRYFTRAAATLAGATAMQSSRQEFVPVRIETLPFPHVRIDTKDNT